MKLNVRTKIIGAAAGLLLAASIPAAGLAEDMIKLGVVGPHSGDLASYGLPSVNAAKILTEQINAAGGINGKKIELLVEDTVCDAKTATDVATKLVSDGAQIVLGGICSGSTKAALPIYQNAGLLVMSPSATNPALTQ
ncbi:MAG: ABC transporter substrate-binding protein, partial [Deltaproteobacteria bacterium]|nr:ABC transporter substrate-binding protein [Deltaproteobacteria bacterium]